MKLEAVSCLCCKVLVDREGCVRQANYLLTFGVTFLVEDVVYK